MYCMFFHNVIENICTNIFSISKQSSRLIFGLLFTKYSSGASSFLDIYGSTSGFEISAEHGNLASAKYSTCSPSFLPCKTIRASIRIDTSTFKEYIYQPLYLPVISTLFQIINLNQIKVPETGDPVPCIELEREANGF